MGALLFAAAIPMGAAGVFVAFVWREFQQMLSSFQQVLYISVKSFSLKHISLKFMISHENL